MSSPTEIHSVKEWNEALRAATAAGRTVVVDFHAEWCGPCKAIAPKYTSLAKDTPQVHFLRVDVDRQKPIAAKYQISAMPTFLAIKSGQVISTLKGADPAGLTRLVQQNAGPNPPVAPLPEAVEKAKEAGNTLFKEGHFSSAIDMYTEALSHAPNSFTLLSNRSLSHLRTTPPSPSLALADAEAATSLAPTWGKGWVRVGEALVALGRGEEAVKAFEKAVEVGEGTVKAEARGKLEEAKKKLGWH